MFGAGGRPVYGSGISCRSWQPVMDLVRIQDSQRLASEQGALRSYDAHITSEEEDLARPKRFTARSVHVANGDREEQKHSEEESQEWRVV